MSETVDFLILVAGVLGGPALIIAIVGMGIGGLSGLNK